MKKFTLLVLLSVLYSINLFSQKSENNNAVVIPCSAFSITRPLSEIFRENPVDENMIYEKQESEDRENRKPQKFRKSVKDGPQYGNDQKSIQDNMGDVPGRAPILNIAGQSATGFRPMDPSGASGPNHYVQMINSTTFKVYNKTTGAVLLTGTLGNLWSPATANNGDPIVMYDKAADRWFLAQFGSSSDKKIFIAVSTTSDPTGSYYTYTYTSPIFPDYLKFSVWADGYYMTSNQSTQKVFCFNRAEMLAGNSGARSIYTNFSPPNGTGFFVPLPGDAADGVLPTYGTPCPIFSYSDNGWGSGYSDAVNIYQMAVNWVPTTPTATITLAANVATAAFDATYNSSWDDVSQPGTTQKLDGIGGVCMYRAQWKTWSGYNTIVLNWAVQISSTQRSIKWCELRQNQSSGVWSMYQEGIYTPDGDTRWMGSITMDNNGSIGLAYMKSNSTSIYPGLYYTGRRSCDPLGTLPITETTVIAGTGYQTGTNRVGDYSHMALDPDGITFWHTSEFMGGTSGSTAAKTRIFSFQLTPCSNTASVTISQTAGTNPLCTGATATFTATPTNGGTTPIYQWQVNGSNVGTNSPTYTSTFTSGQILTCIMTSNLSGVTGSPATSSPITVTVNNNVTPSVSIALTSGSNPSCAGVPLTFTATPVNGGSAPSYQWIVNGVNTGTNSSTFSSSTITNGQIVTCVLTSNETCVTTTTATSNPITISITTNVPPTVSIAQTGGTNPTCAGASVSFTATATNAINPVYQWQINNVNAGTNSSLFTTTSLGNGDNISCIVTSDATCAPATVFTLGTGTALNSTTSDLAAAYPSYYGNGRQQYLIRASELTTLGAMAGNISSLGFTINSTIGSPATMNGYTIKLAMTASTVMTSAFLNPAFTTVFGPVNFTPVVSSTNTHAFASPFTWDGTSNILIDICFSNQVVGTVAYQNYQTTSAFVSTTYYQADGATGAGACATATVTGTGSIRPNMVFNFLSNSSTANSNVLSMTVNSSVSPSVTITQTAGTNPQCTGESASFTATPTNGGTTPSYQWKIGTTNVGTNSSVFTTTTLANNDVVSCIITSDLSCAIPATATSTGITMTVNPIVTPAVSIALTTGTNPTCAGSSVTFTATPTNGGTPSYQWKVDGTNVGTNSATFTTTALTNGQIVSCVMTSTAACASPATATSTGITMTVNPTVTPAVSIALTTGTNPTCAGSSVTFTATPTNGGTPSYQWKVAGTNAGTNSATFTTTTLTNGQIVTCIMTSTATCPSPATATSTGITMTINPTVTPAVSIALTTGTNPTCAGSSVTFTATPTNGGTPSYQWKVAGTNAGTNSATFTTTTLTNGQIVTCVITSTATCASPATATSTGITMTINPVVTPAVSIALTTGTNPTCAGSSVTFTATPTNGGTPSYQWKVSGTNAGTNSASFLTSTLTNGQTVTCVMTSTAACASPVTATSTGITMTVDQNVSPSVTIVASPGNSICAGTNVTFTATPTNGGSTPSYQWKNGSTDVGTNSATFSTTALANGNNITCLMTSSDPCAIGGPAISNAITMTVTQYVAASVSIVASPGNAICTGTNVTFTATPTNGGSPSYQWKNGAANVGTNSSTYSSSALTNGNSITCVMTSGLVCVTGNPATSNPINMTVYSNPVITSLSPSTGTAGTSVTISGSGFTGVSTVLFNGTAASFIFNNDNQITATAPAGGTSGTITVTTTCGSATSAGTFTYSGPVTLHVRAIIEGFYNSGGLMTGVVSPTVCDTIDVSLANNLSPNSIVFTQRGTIDLSGNGDFIFPTARGGTYYIVIRHRNSLQTWSSSAILFSASTMSYDFSTASSQAYGNNLVDLGGIFAIRSGDVNQDGIIDIDDFISVENACRIFSSGYIKDDLTGDGLPESADFSLVENNFSKILMRP